MILDILVLSSLVAFVPLIAAAELVGGWENRAIERRKQKRYERYGTWIGGAIVAAFGTFIVSAVAAAARHVFW